jgi:hypothetical protein
MKEILVEMHHRLCVVVQDLLIEEMNVIYNETRQTEETEHQKKGIDLMTEDVFHQNVVHRIEDVRKWTVKEVETGHYQEIEIRQNMHANDHLANQNLQFKEKCLE